MVKIKILSFGHMLLTANH